MADQTPHDPLDELKNALQAAIASPANPGSQEGCSVQFTLAASVLVPLEQPKIGSYAPGGAQDLPLEFKTRHKGCNSPGEGERDGTSVKQAPLATVEAICSVEDAEKRSIVQRAASRGIKEVIAATDGYRYSINNCWTAGQQRDELPEQRFSYICLDSIQNKDRSLNGAQRTLKHQRSRQRVKGRKPTYDCKGNICIKINSKAGNIEIVYKHIALHNPLPRKNRSTSKALPPSSVRPDQQAFAGPLRPKLASFGSSGYLVSRADVLGTTAKVPVPLSIVGVKRGRDVIEPLCESELEQTMSLAELLRHGDGAKESPMSAPSRERSQGFMHAAPVHYDVPSWDVANPAPVQRPVPPMQHVLKQRSTYQSPYAP